MLKLRTLALLILLASLSIGLYTVQADCPNGTNADNTITCDTNPGGNLLSGNGGNDTITIENTVNAPNANIAGDAMSGTGTGNDTVTNEGNIRAIYGDSDSGAGSGDDTITNNGQTQFLLGDTFGAAGSGDDTIINNGTVTIVIYGDSGVGAGSGNDTIINNGQTNGSIFGDTSTGTGSGADTIINNGSVFGILGDSQNNIGSGNDVIINNGTVITGMTGDTNYNLGSGSDLMINNGIVNNNIYGDSETVNGTGADHIINNGSANGLYGDSVFGNGSGNDLIENYGTANNIYGDTGANSGLNGTGNDHIINGGTVGNIYGGGGNDTVEVQTYGFVSGNIVAGAGDDLVVIHDWAEVAGLMDGGAHAAGDTLAFMYTFEAEDFFIPAEFEAIRTQLASIDLTTCPCTVGLVVNGIYFEYTFTNFEFLNPFMNFIKVTFTPYEEMNCQNGVKCFALKDKAFRNGNVQIYAAEGNQGVAVATVNLRLLGTSGYTFTNEDNGWTVTITYAGTDGDALTYSIVLSKGGDVRNAGTVVLAFQYEDSAFATHALAWR